MISAGEFRNGITFEFEGNVYQVVEFQHVKPGKGAAFVRTKMKNVITGAVVERSFNPTEKVEKAHIERKDMEYIYEDGGLYYFMDQDYEQIPLSKDQLGDALKFVKENMTVTILSYKGNVFAVEPPTFVELQTLQSRQLLRQVRQSMFRCSLTRATRLRLTQEHQSIYQEFNFTKIKPAGTLKRVSVGFFAVGTRARRSVFNAF